MWSNQSSCPRRGERSSCSDAVPRRFLIRQTPSPADIFRRVSLCRITNPEICKIPSSNRVRYLPCSSLRLNCKHGQDEICSVQNVQPRRSLGSLGVQAGRRGELCICSDAGVFGSLRKERSTCFALKLTITECFTNPMLYCAGFAYSD